MAPVQQEPEIQFAQRLASNEKPMRTKAIRKLRKYISVRSQKIQGKANEVTRKMDHALCLHTRSLSASSLRDPSLANLRFVFCTLNQFDLYRFNNTIVDSLEHET